MNISEIDLWDDRIMLDGQLVARVARDADPLDARKLHWLLREIRSDPVRADEIEALRDALEEAEREVCLADDQCQSLKVELDNAEKEIEDLEETIERLEGELEEFINDHD